MEACILEQNTVTLESLSSGFGVSMNTIRRDVNELLKRGRVRKIYGGVAAVRTEEMVPSERRQVINMTAKEEIGHLAAEFVKDGDVVFLDSGTTVPCVIPHLAEKKEITILTYSLAAMNEAAKYPSLKLISLGGYYNRQTDSFFGLSGADGLGGISIDIVLIAATGVSVSNGLTNSSYFETEMKKQAVSSGGKTVLMADASKFGKAALRSFCSIQDLYGIATDKKPEKKYLDIIKENGILLKYRS